MKINSMVDMSFRFHFNKEKKEEIRFSPLTKAPTPAEMSKGQSDNTNNATKKSLPIRLSTNFMTFIPSLTFTEL